MPTEDAADPGTAWDNAGVVEASRMSFAAQADDAPVAVVKATHLSRKPAPGSAAVAAASMALTTAVTAVHWTLAGDASAGLAATAAAVTDPGESWRMVTATLAHADATHWISNVLVFGVLSYLVYGYYGPMVHPLATLGLGSLLTGGVALTYPAHTRLLGVSGVVYLMAGLWLVLYVLVERRLPVAKRLVRALGFALITLVPPTATPHVSHRAHAAGFVIGVLAGALLFAVRRAGLRAAERIEWE